MNKQIVATVRNRPRHAGGAWPALALVLALLAWATTADAASTITLVEQGRSAYRIVIPSDAIPAERYAAEELQRYLERISGAQLPIVTDSDPPTPREILLGDNQHLRRGRTELAGERLGTDGFALRTQGRQLVILGGRPRGTLYGVYALLEEKLGVRWYTAEVESIPRLARVRLPRLDETQVPALEYREVFWREIMRDADFAARHRLNGQHYPLAEKHGGRAVVYHPFVHSFDALVPPDLYRDHPEYFPLIDGQRKGGYVQRCLSNPDVIRISIQRVQQWIREHPEATILSVSQNDTFNYCRCGPCQTLDDAEGTPAASLLKFVNTIAEAIEREHPQVRLDTLAYQYTRKPPKNLRPHPHVIIRLCSIECCFAHPLGLCSSEANRRFRDDIVAWQPVAPRIYVWDYTPNFAHYQQIFPNFDVLQPNVQFFVQHGVTGLFEQGNYSSGGQGEMGPLRAYLLAKLLWNPQTDVARHQTEFLQAYFGPAADLVRAYLDVTHRPVRGQDCHAHIFDKATACYLTDDVLREGERLLDEAEQRADTAAIRLRVQVARLPVWYSQLATERITGEARQALLKRFLTVARQAGISNISEGKSLEGWAKQMGAE
jgi:hypothetical protein